MSSVFEFGFAQNLEKGFSFFTPTGTKIFFIKFLIINFLNMTKEEKIKEALEEIRPSLQSDGGDVQFISWDEKTGLVQVQLLGMCSGCPMAGVTLKDGIEKQLKKVVPEVKNVENV